MTVEILNLKRDIEMISENIKCWKNCIQHLKNQKPIDRKKIKENYEKIEKWEKEKYELKKELVVLETSKL